MAPRLHQVLLLLANTMPACCPNLLDVGRTKAFLASSALHLAGVEAPYGQCIEAIMAANAQSRMKAKCRNVSMRTAALGMGFVRTMGIDALAALMTHAHARRIHIIE